MRASHLSSAGGSSRWRPRTNGKTFPAKTRIAVMNRKSHEVKWFDKEPFFVFHFLNATRTKTSWSSTDAACSSLI